MPKSSIVFWLVFWIALMFFLIAAWPPANAQEHGCYKEDLVFDYIQTLEADNTKTFRYETKTSVVYYMVTPKQPDFVYYIVFVDKCMLVSSEYVWSFFPINDTLVHNIRKSVLILENGRPVPSL